jgi:hypothetical protein
MKTYIVTEEQLDKIIAKITDNLNAKARKTGVSLSSVTESIRQAIKYHIAKNSHEEQLPQRQDSLTSQLKDLIPLANKMGCYDAADYLKNVCEVNNVNNVNN